MRPIAPLDLPGLKPADHHPHLPEIELFARGPRAGWDVWGNEADGAEP